MKTLHLISLGCTKNLVDSEVMLGKLKKYELIDNPRLADIIIINTCGFIASAKQESINKILEVAHIKKDDSILIVSGCLSQRYSNELREEIKEIDIITGVGDYDKIYTLITNYKKDSKNKTAFTNKTFLIDNQHRVITGSNIHAYIKISEGCNQQCSFCAIPNFKGKLQSRSIQSCIKEIEILIKNGYKDFTLIAQDSSSYMKDLNKKDGLLKLIDEIEKIDGIKSARILYLYPSTVSMELLEKIGESKIFQNYFDMPLQHISNYMLGIMKRGANRNKHIDLLNKMREIKNSFIRTTFLIGHPEEREEDFIELCDFIDEFKFDRINLFAYSKEENTRAYNMNNHVDSNTTKKRIMALDKIIKKQQKEIFENYVGKNIKAIIDGISKESELFFSARDIKWDREIDGEILINDNLTNNPIKSGYYEVKIDSYKDGYLIGRAINRL